MKNIDKKIIIKFSIGIFALLLLIVGATYAYFELNANIEKSTTSISTELEDMGSVALITGDNMYMDITFTDMKKYSNSDINYYASVNGKTLEETEEVIAYTQISGKNTYKCTYEIEVTDQSTNSIYNAFQNMDTKSEGQIVLTIDGKDYDFNTNSLFPLTIKGTFENIWDNKPGEIKAKLKVVNSTSINQTGFAGTNIDLSFNVKKFNCEVNEKIYLANDVISKSDNYKLKNTVPTPKDFYDEISDITVEIENYDEEIDDYTYSTETLNKSFTFENDLWNLNIPVSSFSEDGEYYLASLNYVFDITTDGKNEYFVCLKSNDDLYYNSLYINIDSSYKDDHVTDTISYMSINSLNCYNLGTISKGKHTIEIFMSWVELYSDTSSFSFNVQTFETIDSVGYRYSGSNPNNYVSFNEEMWRIIGVVPTCTSENCATKENLLKIIRDESLGTLVYDAKSSGYIGDWGNNTLYKLLNNYYYGATNGTDSGYCYKTSSTKTTCDYTNIGINPESLYGKMVKNVFWNTGHSSDYVSTNSSYLNEVSNQTLSGYVGLITASDYGYSSTIDYYNKTLSNTEISKSNWLDLNPKWTMTGNSNSTNSAMYVDHFADIRSSISNAKANIGYDVRPVVYLDKDVYITEGDGTKDNPYQIAL